MRVPEKLGLELMARIFILQGPPGNREGYYQKQEAGLAADVVEGVHERVGLLRPDPPVVHGRADDGLRDAPERHRGTAC